MTSNRFSAAHVSNPTRRRFLQFSAAALSSVALANCQRGSDPNAQTAPAEQTSAPATGPLHIYTWADYSNPEVYKKFTDKTGIEVIADVYEANEVMLAKMLAGGGTQYSVIYPSDYMVRQMIELDLLSTIDPTRLTGMEKLRDRWQNPPYDANNTHSVPVSWGTTGFIYNTKLLNPGPDDWNFIWENKGKLARKMTLLDDVREVLGATLKSLGYSYNSTDPKELDDAYRKLKELKPAVRSFESFGWEDRLIAGDLTLCMTYSIIGNKLPIEHPELKFVIPKSGTSVWTDTIAIPKTAPNANAAYAWINFMLEPENASFAVDKLKFATPNTAAFELLSNDLKTNTNLFPSEEMLAKCEGIASVGKASETYEKLWTQLKSV